MNIDYYEQANGRCPVLEFLEGLPAKDQVRVMKKIDLLEALGLNLRRPHADFLRDGIHELRVRTNHGQYRVLYFIFHRNTAVLLHGITKNVGRVPDGAIDRAVAYMDDYLRTQREE
jgi:phage-related protein